MRVIKIYFCANPMHASQTRLHAADAKEILDATQSDVNIVFVGPPHSGLKYFLSWAAARLSMGGVPTHVIRPSSANKGAMHRTWKSQRAPIATDAEFGYLSIMSDRLARRALMLRECARHTAKDSLARASGSARAIPRIQLIAGSVIEDGIAMARAAHATDAITTEQRRIIEEVVFGSHWHEEQSAFPKSTTVYVYVRPDAKAYEKRLRERSLPSVIAKSADVCISRYMQVRHELGMLFSSTEMAKLMQCQTLSLEQDFVGASLYCERMLGTIIGFVQELYSQSDVTGWGTPMTREVMYSIIGLVATSSAAQNRATKQAVAKSSSVDVQRTRSSDSIASAPDIPRSYAVVAINSSSAPLGRSTSENLARSRDSGTSTTTLNASTLRAYKPREMNSQQSDVY